jgi:ElaB/YqjD/DUF883 family membrane-anchored ribosome-binding protein
MSDKEEVFTHESYGMVGLSRCTGRVRLFGSAIPYHDHFIALRVHRAERTHHLSRDWYRAKSLTPIVEVFISAAQFADMITSMNMSEGIPCTLRRVQGQQMEEPPDLETEAEKVQTDFKDDIKKVAVELKAARNEVEELLSKKSLNKGDRAQIQDKFDRILQHIQSNVPFVLESFQEATEKVVTHAKAEVEAFTTTRIMAAGIKAIQDQNELPEPSELPALEAYPRTGLMCSECGMPQYNTPGGEVCKNGHGGAPGVKP